MISAINSIVFEEDSGSNIEKKETSPRKCGKRGASSHENKIGLIRREKPNERKSKENLKIKKLKRKVNLEYFYELLFTRKNLKLVHIVCHDKQEHISKRCDEDKLFVYCNNKDEK